MSKYHKIESGQSIIDAIEFLLEMEHDPEIVTHRVLNGGIHTVYTWCLVEPGGDVTLNYMDEDIVIPRSSFEKEWNETYANGMCLPPFERNITLLGDGSSWIGDVGAVVYQVDERFYQHMSETDKGYDDLDRYPVLSEATHSLEDLADAVGEFSSSDLLAVFELARMALSDADNFDEMAYDMDVSDEEMKSLQEKLNRHLEKVST